MLPSSSSLDAVDHVVREGRGLLRRQALLNALSWGGAVTLAGLVLLLLLGSTWFPPVLLGVLLLIGIGVSIRIWHTSQQSDYDIARALDHNWNSADQIATACYFNDGAEIAAPAVKAQRRLAAAAASGQDVGMALAHSAPFAVWYAGVLLFAVFALVGIRYSVAPQLALESPLPPLLYPQWDGSGDDTSDAALVADQSSREVENRENQSRADQQLAEARETATPMPPSIDPLATDGDDAAGGIPEVEGLDNAGDQLGFDEADTQDAAGEEGSPDEQGSNLEREADANERGDAESDWGQQSNSLLDRLKEALKQMSDGQGSASPQRADQKSAAEQQESSNAEAAPDSNEDGTAEVGDSPGAAAAASMESDSPQPDDQQQPAQGGGESPGSGNEGQGESAGAAGSGEGNKEIADALATQETFDSLEEFYLRRAEELSGEVLVETTSGEGSTAATPYRTQQGSHVNATGLALRDQAPPAYTTFVENYFREIRSKEE